MSQQDACSVLALARVINLRRLLNELERDCVHCPCQNDLLPIIKRIKGDLEEALWALSAFEHSEPQV
jgi:hypothetical protein